MYKSILSIILLVTLLSCVNSQKVPSAYGVFNDPKTSLASAGIINLSTAQTTTMFTSNGYFLPTNTPSTYNPTTGLISFISFENSSSTYYLTTVSTKTWTIVNDSHVYAPMTMNNLAYDNTDSEYNLFATFVTGDGNLYVAKLSITDAYYKTFDTIENVYPNATATFLAEVGKFMVCYVDASGNDLCKYYSTELDIEGPVTFELANMASGWVQYSSPYFLSYLPNQNKTICQLVIRNVGYSTFYGGPQMFWATTSSQQFYNSGWITSTIRSQIITQQQIFSDFTLPRVYQFATALNQKVVTPYMYTYSTYNNQWVLTQAANVFIINAWSFQ